MNGKIDRELLERLTKSFLESLGNNINADIYNETPRRVADAWAEMLGGYDMDEEELYKIFPTLNNNLVLIRNIEFTSICEHHLLPFTGIVHVGYIPNGKVLGLSKFARIVNCFSKKLQIQEKMVFEIGNSIARHLEPKGLFVIARAKHSCMVCRGVKQTSSDTVTFFTYGKFESYRENELLAMVE